MCEDLPGHGTTIKDCNRTRYQDWLTHAEWQTAKLASRGQEIVLLGHSMGAVLALHLASLFPVRCMVLSAPTLIFNNPFWINNVVPLVSFFKSGWSKPDVFGRFQEEPGAVYKYSHYPLKALVQFNRLTSLVKTELPGINTPLLIQYSKEDTRSPYYNVEFIQEQVASQNIQVSGFDDVGHNLWYKSVKQSHIFSEVLSFIQSQNP